MKVQSLGILSLQSALWGGGVHYYTTHLLGIVPLRLRVSGPVAWRSLASSGAWLTDVLQLRPWEVRALDL